MFRSKNSDMFLQMFVFQEIGAVKEIPSTPFNTRLCQIVQLIHFVHLLLRYLDVPGAKVPRYLYYIMEEILSNSTLVGRCYSSMTRALLPWQLDYTSTAVGGEPGLWKQGGSHSLIRMIRTRLEDVLKAITKVGCFQKRKPAWTWQSTSVSGARAAAEKAQKATQLCSTASAFHILTIFDLRIVRVWNEFEFQPKQCHGTDWLWTPQRLPKWSMALLFDLLVWSRMEQSRPPFASPCAQTTARQEWNQWTRMTIMEKENWRRLLAWFQRTSASSLLFFWPCLNWILWTHPSLCFSVLFYQCSSIVLLLITL